MEELKINWYSVKSCGYYEAGEGQPEFCGFRQLLTQVRSWAFKSELRLEESCTFEPDEVGLNLRAFFFDLAETNNGEILLVTWNETETLDGSMASVSGSDPVGSAQVDKQDVPPGHIPGYPTYFWILPDRGKFCTIRFGSRLNGHQGLKHLLRSFLISFSEHVVRDNDDDTKVVGYRQNEQEESLPLMPLYDSGPIRVLGPIEQIRANRATIVKVCRKSELSIDEPDDRNRLERVFSYLGFVDATPAKDELRIYTEIEHAPSHQELESLIGEFENEHGSRWADIGFKFRGDPETHWLGTSLVKDSFQEELIRNEDGIVTAENLMNAVQRHRAALLQALTITE